MSRDTGKYRGKRVDNGEWVEGSLYEFKDAKYITINVPHKKYSTGYETKFLSHGLLIHPSFRVIPETVGQCTGLKDKNGVEIYEGDVLDTIEDSGSYYPNRVVVECHAMAFMFVGVTENASPYCKYTLSTITTKGYTIVRDMEIIGTIHDTPKEAEE